MTNKLMDDNIDQIDIDPAKNYLEDLVGEGKKFKTVEDLARGKYEADIRIQTMEQRMDELREDFFKVKNENIAVPRLQELLDRLEQQSLTSREQNRNSNEDQNEPALPKTDVKSLITEEFQKLKQTEIEENNYNTVVDKLTERFGNSYKSVLSNQAKALGMSAEQVDRMARTNPKLFAKTFDLDSVEPKNNFQTPPRNNLRSDTFAPKPEKRTMSYYRELRKKDPTLYYDAKITNQMHKDAQTLGSAFFD